MRILDKLSCGCKKIEDLTAPLGSGYRFIDICEQHKLCPNCEECDQWIELDNNGRTRSLQCEYCGHEKEVGVFE